MPRKKSLVHSHYRVAADQPQDKKLEVVSCIHCGKTFAGNNAARLLEHLQKGCWPAANQNDPALELSNDGTPQAPPQYTPGAARMVSTPQSGTKQSGSRLSSRSVNFAPKLPSTSPTHFIVQIVVKDTKDPVVTRVIAAPVTYTFRHLQRALSAALSYRNINGMYEIAAPAPMQGRGQLPRTRRVYVFSDQEQRAKWHRHDIDADAMVEEHMADDLLLQTIVADLAHCKISYTVGPWAHDIEVLGSITLAGGLSGKAARHALCLSGEGHPVPESTDAMMWETFKDAFSAPAPNAQQKRYRAFYEEDLVNGDPRGLANGGPWRWEREHVNRELSLLPAAPLPVNMPAGQAAGQQDAGNADAGAEQRMSDADADDEENNESGIAGAGHHQGDLRPQGPYQTPSGGHAQPPNPYTPGPSHPPGGMQPQQQHHLQQQGMQQQHGGGPNNGYGPGTGHEGYMPAQSMRSY